MPNKTALSWLALQSINWS